MSGYQKRATVLQRAVIRAASKPATMPDIAHSIGYSGCEVALRHLFRRMLDMGYIDVEFRDRPYYFATMVGARIAELNHDAA